MKRHHITFPGITNFESAIRVFTICERGLVTSEKIDFEKMTLERMTLEKMTETKL